MYGNEQFERCNIQWRLLKDQNKPVLKKHKHDSNKSMSCSKITFVMPLVHQRREIFFSFGADFARIKYWFDNLKNVRIGDWTFGLFVSYICERVEVSCSAKQQLVGEIWAFDLKGQFFKIQRGIWIPDFLVSGFWMVKTQVIGQILKAPALKSSGLHILVV